MSDTRFLLIKAWGWGFWADMDHLIGQLLVAELTNRIPVVSWGTNSLYSDTILTNAFELYYEPVSNYTLKDVARPEFTYYPPIWNYVNIMIEDLDKITYTYRDIGNMMSSDANVVVSDVHYFARPIMEYIKKDNWMYGLTPIQIYRCLIDKYLRLKPDILMKIDDFYNKFLKDSGPLLGVHVRGTDKIIEVANLPYLNKRYHYEIRKYIKNFDIKKILMITDSQEILNEYIDLYGDIIISTDANRSENNSEHSATQVDNYINRRSKGIEVLVDTYLASKCDYFIGNGYSNVSFSVNRLKEWPQSHITLLYNSLKEEIKLAKKRSKVELLRKQNQKLEHRLNYPELYGGI
ncbi:O-fucosyltransferase family protein [Candidatus Galacturonibacter soehngenii]|uniref:Alpha-(1,6)-fucosyltransferase N- and catalytic domain-containing protein n=1 Tax=Candidatus Galacturonatibacter soehngenii TaxID=2307010 RepID=A0A7V7UCL2_9FIRM|nr:O-fucosyltransferase family protein [Candidatus Galacturonibacter soehngenii]KAB1439311.1 hypothetical protein F7O84_02635 [Candidatus Galacturonibacter soehngenii]MBA4687501.1 hypothetical protein [Candidatus Galacturonibacter soehngenii]